ncbi:hypothetical protein CK203_046544 [Vitis vinifera]|uniref:Uncharacterized protein n=1 Tax=Vitis vinifera TaxID=29760 RepID=A0A438ILH6_VITVI|nr:hypothetical protein CK203_046544 [Vitis vinifera]
MALPIEYQWVKTSHAQGFDFGFFRELAFEMIKDVYLSGEGCSDYARKDSIAYIRNPGSIDEKLPLASVNGISGEWLMGSFFIESAP